MKIKKNDTVLVITGKDKNNDLEKASKVLAVFPKENPPCGTIFHRASGACCPQRRSGIFPGMGKAFSH